jgi:hypothetical protein
MLISSIAQFLQIFFAYCYEFFATIAERRENMPIFFAGDGGSKEEGVSGHG